jgi:hypothetical protein
VADVSFAPTSHAVSSWARLVARELESTESVEDIQSVLRVLQRLYGASQAAEEVSAPNPTAGSLGPFAGVIRRATAARPAPFVTPTRRGSKTGPQPVPPCCCCFDSGSVVGSQPLTKEDHLAVVAEKFFARVEHDHSGPQGGDASQGRQMVPLEIGGTADIQAV